MLFPPRHQRSQFVPFCQTFFVFIRHIIHNCSRIMPQKNFSTPFDSSISYKSLATLFLSSHAWQRKTSLKSGTLERTSTFLRTGVSVRISSGVYKIVEPTGDQLALVFVCPLILLLEALEELLEGEKPGVGYE